ncbi:MAG: ferrous iron transporter B [Bdellovibrionales bacterium]|nr:ferrous iron transporter B [Bdellovibrionales bacterium]
MKPESSVILVGPPNSGKTTLFNWLTGFKSQVVNYPGSTVQLSTGSLQKKYSLNVQITDTPGIYSLFTGSADEKITRQFLFSKSSPVVLVLDSMKLEIQLPLLFQLKEAGFQVIVVLTMSDLMEASLDIKALSQLVGSPVVSVKGLTGEGVQELVSEMAVILQKPGDLSQPLKNWDVKKRNQILEKSRHIVRQSQKGQKKNVFLSEKFDRFFLHPRWGIVLFCAVMFSLFSSLFWLAEPFMSAVDSFIGFSIDKILHWGGESWWADLTANGIVMSLGAVLVFVPQIFILFAGISLLEDTGYLARAVALADGPLSRIGLSGKAFVPFLSGYACAIPAVLAARNLPSKRERWMAWFAIPFMSCSARLPVYTLLLSFLFYGQAAWKPGLALTAIYTGSLILGMGACFFLNKILKPESQKNPFIVDFPLYRSPRLLKIFQHAYRQTKHYVIKAGPTIFFFALIVWVATNFSGNLTPVKDIQYSYAGYLGRWIEPFFETMGLDWRVGVGLLAAFAAREVFVSAVALLFSVTSSGESFTSSLLEQMNIAVNSQGDKVFTTASTVGLIVFFMFSLQWLSTTAIVYKESGSLRLAGIQLVLLNLVAYVAAVLTYQSLRFLF